MTGSIIGTGAVMSMDTCIEETEIHGTYTTALVELPELITRQEEFSQHHHQALSAEHQCTSVDTE